MRTESGVKKGDRVLIYMPMIPEAAVAMLACARIGTYTRMCVYTLRTFNECVGAAIGCAYMYIHPTTQPMCTNKWFM